MEHIHIFMIKDWRFISTLSAFDIMGSILECLGMSPSGLFVYELTG